jgi:uncharacterized BrkB/YihY/UPF0761 family membrane protein
MIGRRAVFIYFFPALRYHFSFGKEFLSMNKTLNSVLFVIGATVFLTLVILVLFFGLLLPALALMPPSSDADTQGVKLLVGGIILMVSIVGAFFIYTAVLKLLIKKFDIEKYLARKKQRPPKPVEK